MGVRLDIRGFIDDFKSCCNEERKSHLNTDELIEYIKWISGGDGSFTYPLYESETCDGQVRMFSFVIESDGFDSDVLVYQGYK